MCGIVGLYLKDDALQPELGRRLAPMLIEMTDRGPDSAGFAVDRNGAPQGWTKLTLFHPEATYDWDALEQGLADALETQCDGFRRASHFVLMTAATTEAARRWIGEHDGNVRIMSVGESIEIYKEKGLPKDVAARFGLEAMSGTHAIGHTRMATESDVDIRSAHPYWAYPFNDVSVVHNGQLTNYWTMRRDLERRGHRFVSDCDSELIAVYIADRINQGDELETAMRTSIDVIDGVFTYLVATSDQLGMAKDVMGAKPMVLYESDEFVGLASEEVAMRSIFPREIDTWDPYQGEVKVWAA